MAHSAPRRARPPSSHRPHAPLQRIKPSSARREVLLRLWTHSLGGTPYVVPAQRGMAGVIPKQQTKEAVWTPFSLQDPQKGPPTVHQRNICLEKSFGGVWEPSLLCHYPMSFCNKVLISKLSSDHFSSFHRAPAVHRATRGRPPSSRSGLKPWTHRTPTTDGSGGLKPSTCGTIQLNRL